MDPLFSALFILVFTVGPLLAISALRAPRPWPRVLAAAIGAEIAVFYAAALLGSMPGAKGGDEPFWRWLGQLTVAAVIVGAVVGAGWLLARRMYALNR